MTAASPYCPSSVPSLTCWSFFWVSRMSLSTWSALACMREMSSASSWVAALGWGREQQAWTAETKAEAHPPRRGPRLLYPTEGGEAGRSVVFTGGSRGNLP